jgi:hypothetical protein
VVLFYHSAQTDEPEEGQTRFRRDFLLTEEAGTLASSVKSIPHLNLVWPSSGSSVWADSRATKNARSKHAR